MFEKERERCHAGIKKCDALLDSDRCEKVFEKKNSEVDPRKLVMIWKARNFDSLFLQIFYANAKLGFINRLVKMQEAEDESCVVRH